MRRASGPTSLAGLSGAAAAAGAALRAAWGSSALGSLQRGLRGVGSWPPARVFLRAWDGSWLGKLAREAWSPGVAAPRPGEGLALAGLAALAAFDAWAFHLAPFAAAGWVALGLSLLVVLAGETAGLYVTVAAIPFVPDVPALALVLALVGSALARRLDAAGWDVSRLLGRRAGAPLERGGSGSALDRAGSGLALGQPGPGLFGLDLPVVLLGLLLVAATVTSVDAPASLRYLLTWLLAIGLYGLVAGQARQPRVLTRVALALGLSAAIAGLYGLYQFAAHVPVQRAWIDVRIFPEVRTRVFAFWDNPNVFALHLLLAGPVLASALWAGRDRSARLAVALAVVVAGLALVLTLSRAGWVGLAVAIFFISVARDRRLLLAGLLVAAAAFAVAPEVVLVRVSTLTTFSDPTSLHRIRVWEAAWRMVRDFWYSGLGLSWRAFAAVYPQYAIGGRVAFHAHSHYLETLIELGVLGFVLLHVVLLRPLAWVAGLPRRLRETPAGSVLVGAAAAVAGGLAFGVGEPIFYLPRLILLAWAVLGLASAARDGLRTAGAPGGGLRAANAVGGLRAAEELGAEAGHA